MRNRETIENDLEHVAKSPVSIEAKGVAIQSVVIELLLDIRDLLENPLIIQPAQGIPKKK